MMGSLQNVLSDKSDLLIIPTKSTYKSYCAVLLVIVCPELIGIACIRNLIPWSSSNPNVFSWAQILKYVCVMVPKCPLGEATTHGPISG